MDAKSRLEHQVCSIRVENRPIKEVRARGPAETRDRLRPVPSVREGRMGGKGFRLAGIWDSLPNPAVQIYRNAYANHRPRLSDFPSTES